jgi:hypothetical protein
MPSLMLLVDAAKRCLAQPAVAAVAAAAAAVDLKTDRRERRRPTFLCPMTFLLKRLLLGYRL